MSDREEAQARRVKLALDRLAEKAREHAHRVATLPGEPAESGPGLEHLVKVYLDAWQVLMSVTVFRDETELWIASAMLWPKGRGSVLADWELLGTIVAISCHGDEAAMAHASKQASGETGQSPNDPIHWSWMTAPVKPG